MEENRIIIDSAPKETTLLAMGGTDSRGNLWQVDNRSFLKNGKRFLPVMGEFHFSRYEPEDWEEELLKMRAGGVDIAATYVFWIHHEERQGEWDFTGCRDLRRFLEICRRIDMPVWLRIGPWAHGECRNGGFPDWVVSDPERKVRTNDPAYLELVKAFYNKVGEQAAGMTAKDGGPVLGIQLENEYGHCGGPSDREEGMAHLLTLKRLAKEAGLDAPYYTATGWGGAYVADGEMLPVLGGYVDAPWAEHVEQMPASANFVFSAYKQDENIGSDLKREDSAGFTFDPSRNPYLTAELGGGLQVTSHRRTWPSAKDIEAQSVCMLGGGANLLGYYMYHGGINPDGKYSTLQESRATGYNNDLPVKSYDFQTCIRESGEINKSFGTLKKLHLLLHDFGESLAGTQTFFAQKQPESPEDLHTLRVTARVNPETGAGFLFVNNHQRHRTMEVHPDASVRLQFPDHEKEIDRLHLPEGACGVIPFDFPFADAVLEKTNAFLLCRLGERLFFYLPDEISNQASDQAFDAISDQGGEKPDGRTAERKPYFVWKNGKSCDVAVLSESEADRAFRFGNRLYVTERPDDCLIEKDGKLYLITKAEKETLTVYAETGEPQRLTVEAAHAGAQRNDALEAEHGNGNGALEAEAGRAQAAARFELVKEADDAQGKALYREYAVHMDIPEKLRGEAPASCGCHQLYLEADYAGDRAEIYVDGRLADDWFTNGETWHAALKRLGYPSRLTLRIYSTDNPIPNPYGNRVYYDLPVKEGCGLFGVRVIPEYEVCVAEH